MKPFGSSFGAIVVINMQLLSAFAYGAIAWAVWPQTIEWWGLGIISIVLGAAAPVALLNALRGIAALRMRRRALADYMAQGGTPKSAQMASDRDLRRAGMIE
jgi:hypothetical protein